MKMAYRMCDGQVRRLMQGYLQPKAAATEDCYYFLISRISPRIKRLIYVHTYVPVPELN